MLGQQSAVLDPYAHGVVDDARLLRSRDPSGNEAHALGRCDENRIGLVIPDGGDNGSSRIFDEAFALTRGDENRIRTRALRSPTVASPMHTASTLSPILLPTAINAA